METRKPGSYGFWQTAASSMAIARRWLSIAFILAWKRILGTNPARFMAGRSKKRPTTQSESWGKRMNSSSPRSAIRAQRKSFPPREEWHVRAMRLAQTCQSRPHRVSEATSAPIAAERVLTRFRYQSGPAAPGMKRSGNKEKRVERSPPNASFAGMSEITKLVHFSLASNEYLAS